MQFKAARKTERGECGRDLLPFVILSAILIGLGARGASGTTAAWSETVRASVQVPNWHLTAAAPRQQFGQTEIAVFADEQRESRTPFAMRESLRATNDLRVYLANMARAKHDGNSIGIAVDASDVKWLDDKVASTK